MVIVLDGLLVRMGLNLRLILVCDRLLVNWLMLLPRLVLLSLLSYGLLMLLLG